MNGKEVYEYIDGINGHQCLFQYLESGFLYDVVGDTDLLKFWNESDQDMPNEVHLFLTHEGHLNVVLPNEEVEVNGGVNDEVIGPLPQSRIEPYVVGCLFEDEKTSQHSTQVSEDYLSKHANQQTSQAPAEQTCNTPAEYPSQSSLTDEQPS
ncbi:hypothetical protein MKX03_001808 [Papaver bracteatum]|nr:hypothetical protein MKX03_001808 [Papaver bracteatum]